MPKITCDVDRANAELQTIYERHEALGCHLWSGIKAGIAAHNRHELAHRFNMATPAEIKLPRCRMSSAAMRSMISSTC